jgi:hypothetical protein
LGGSEALAAGSVNVGIYDRKQMDFLLCDPSFDTFWCLERAAFYWVKEYISQFGGDPNKVIL